MSDDVMSSEIREYQKIRKRIGKSHAVRIFFYQLVAYALGNIFLGAWNIFTLENRGIDVLWFYFPLIFWDIGVIIHYLQDVALFNDRWDQDEMNTENIIRDLAAERRSDNSDEPATDENSWLDRAVSTALLRPSITTALGALRYATATSSVTITTSSTRPITGIRFGIRSIGTTAYPSATQSNTFESFGVLWSAATILQTRNSLWTSAKRNLSLLVTSHDPLVCCRSETQRAGDSGAAGA